MQPIDVECRSEIRLNNCNLSYCNLREYNLFHCNSKTNAGGAAMFVADRLNCQQLFHIKIKAKACELS